MKLFCICLTALIAAALPLQISKAAEKPVSTLSIYAGKYAGAITFQASFTGPAQGVFKASSTREKGSFDLNSTTAFSTLLYKVGQSFRFNGNKVHYSLSLMEQSNGMLASGTGSGKVTIQKRGMHVRANLVLTDNGTSEPCSINAVFIPREKSMHVSTQITSNGRTILLMDYQLKKKAG